MLPLHNKRDRVRWPVSTSGLSNSLGFQMSCCLALFSCCLVLCFGRRMKRHNLAISSGAAGRYPHTDYPPSKYAKRPPHPQHDVNPSMFWSTSIPPVTIACVPQDQFSCQILILIVASVMGATGSGKTSVSRARPVIMTRNSPGWPQFINLASGSSLRIGMGLGSSTTEVQLAEEFTVDGKRVILIDTPGFDDVSKSDADILKTIAAFLAIT